MKLLILGATALYTLFTTLDPSSVSQALAFYELYPDSPEGQLALERARHLLGTRGDIRDLTKALHHGPGTKEPLTENELTIIEELGSRLANRKLKGYQATTEEEVLKLSEHEIDLGKALILSQSEQGDAALARDYSARLDLMALQVLATLPRRPSPADKIAAINHFLFEEMHIKFPPQSTFAKDIDRYTFLASVMDDHLGVCLGVTTVYLALAQRLDLPLEIITPPGHIFVRYREGKKVINIETTARGVDMPSEVYLGVNTCRLQERNMKEVVGMTHVNQASVYLHGGKYDKAKLAYEKALPYMNDDPFVEELLAYTYLFEGEELRGRWLLEKVKDHLPDHAVAGRVLARDYLEGKVNLEGIKAVFTLVDQTRESLLEKKEQLESVLARYPEFRDGHLQLGITWVQLGRAKEALTAFENYHMLNDRDPQAAYYLAVLNGERHDYRKSWDYLVEAETIVAERFFSPKALQELREELCLNCPP